MSETLMSETLMSETLMSKLCVFMHNYCGHDRRGGPVVPVVAAVGVVAGAAVIVG